MPLDIDHLLPEALGGVTARENLWLACPRCNDFKGDRVEAPDPVTDAKYATLQSTGATLDRALFVVTQWCAHPGAYANWPRHS